MDNCVKEQRKDFELLLDRFKDQREFMTENVQRIEEKLNDFKLEPSNKTESKESLSPSDVLSNFDMNFDGMNALNQRLQRCADKLSELV